MKGIPNGVLEDILAKHVPEGAEITNGAVDVVAACTEEFVRVLLARTNEIARGQAKNDLVRMMPGHVLQALEAFPGLHAKMPCLEDSQSKKAGASKKRKSRAKAHNADDDADLKAEQAALFKRAAAESQHRHIVVPKIIPSTEYRDE
ncbi:hypothetical protein H257_02375 [Aphanomyces astaci]|uniref:Transcription factor CBF/NF-Y/archaeal histone domain-containing protein n=1 Tax=Aphanomyces astaci TaxID=112090 RepID=W4H1M5_APHAT|nr:hypothetical protein H257_02375 [Aphanomyces astaci]ETV85807.1 hypothetical protein H257_02375 [Aphanomyces astaci]|eukprot:XP_009824279.1 hypothetical protein H257_02375 [Aphanomyces astaci]